MLDRVIVAVHITTLMAMWPIYLEKSLSSYHVWNDSGIGYSKVFCYRLHVLIVVHVQRASVAVPRYASSEIVRRFLYVLD